MNIKKIKITSTVEDINIKEGNSFKIIGGTYQINDDELDIHATSDLNLVVTKNDFQNISIKTDVGNAYIEFNESTIQHLEFNSECGDLEVSAKVGFTNFNSIGEYICSESKKIVISSNSSTYSATTSRTQEISKSKNRYINERYE